MDSNTHARRQDAMSLDWDAARRRIPGGPQGLLRLAALMREEGRRHLREIRGGIESGDAGQVRLAAHTLRGAAMHFSADRVVSCAAAVEIAAAAGHLDAVREALPELEREVGRLLEELKAGGGSA